MSIDNSNFEKYFDDKKYSSSNQELKKKKKLYNRKEYWEHFVKQGWKECRINCFTRRELHSIYVLKRESEELKKSKDKIKKLVEIPTSSSNNLKQYLKKKIKIFISTDLLMTMVNMMKLTLCSFNLDCEIIHELEDNCVSDENTIYIIVYNNYKKNIMPKKYIFWQIEQCNTTNTPVEKFTERYFNDMNNSLAIFDFSQFNINSYSHKIENIKKIFYVPFPFYDTINHINDKYMYDLVFFGGYSDRRGKILNEISSRLNNKFMINFFFGLQGEERDQILKQTKYVLNIHYYEDSQLEIERFNTCLNFNCLIISEDSKNIDINKPNYKDVVSFFDYIDIEEYSDGNINSIVKLINYNLQKEVFYEKIKRINEYKNKLQQYGRDNLYKVLLDHNLRLETEE